MPHYRVLAGGHCVGKTRYDVGSVVESPHDLVGMYGSNKFVEVEDPNPGGVPAMGSPYPQQSSITASNPMPTATKERESMPVLEDVTGEFPEAEAADLLVFKLSGWYYLAENEGGPPIENRDDGRIRKSVRKKDVDKAVKEILSEETPA